MSRPHLIESCMKIVGGLFLRSLRRIRKMIEGTSLWLASVIRSLFWSWDRWIFLMKMITELSTARSVNARCDQHSSLFCLPMHLNTDEPRSMHSKIFVPAIRRQKVRTNRITTMPKTSTDSYDIVNHWEVPTISHPSTSCTK
mgnify:FL=1